MAEGHRCNLRRRNIRMSSENEDFGDTGSVTIEGDWYTDSSSQGSGEEIVVDESESVASEELNKDGDSEENIDEEIDDEENEEKDDEEKDDEEKDDEENREETLLLDSEPTKACGSDTDSVNDSSDDSVNGKQSGERLIIHPDIETAKVLILKGDENIQLIVKAVKDNVQDAAKKIKANINEASEKVQDSLQNTSERVHVIYKNVKDNVSETTEKFKTNIGEASERVQSSYQNTSDKIHVIYQNVKDNVSETMHEAGEKADKLRKVMIEAGRSGWYLISHLELPHWLRDNEYLSDSHRPPIASFKYCFKSIFRVHTETGNIWTHLLGCLLFIALLLYFYLRPISQDNPFPKDWSEKLVFGAFFTGAILCLAFSTVFHTVYCHSHNVSKIFSRLDYSGIALLIMGSFIPPLYYGFYCSRTTRLIYMVVVTALGFFSFCVSLYPNFNTPKFRCLRAAVFLTFGCSGVVPAIHFIVAYGATLAHQQASVGWMALMGLLYILGAIAYATRVPERFSPGRFNIWFQSHQIFHVLVVAAALVHLYGICQMAYYRFSIGTKCH